MKTKFLYAILFLCCGTAVFSQETLLPNRVVKFSLKPTVTKAFNLNLKKGEFAGIKMTAIEDSGFFRYKIFAPANEDLTKYAAGREDEFYFLAPAAGIYRVEFKPETYEEAKTAASNYTIKYTNRFVLPKDVSVKASRQVNGYDAKIYTVNGESDDAYFVIEKAGKMKFLTKTTKNVGGLYFPDSVEDDVSEAGKESAELFRTTADKTGDGTPDLAVGYYSGGAHCCFSMYFYELGDEVKPIKGLETGDADIAVVGKSANGSLRLSSGDNAFAYWNTSFAGSPIPEIILDFRGGAFRPNAELMKKPAPPIAELKKEAAEVRAKMPLGAYVDDKSGIGFDESFWGRMLDLIYTGHADLAWQYFDWAWNPQKKGKENFKRDFEKQLASSEFYQELRAGK